MSIQTQETQGNGSFNTTREWRAFEELTEGPFTEERRILHTMDDIVQEFIGAVEEQGYPGPNPRYMAKNQSSLEDAEQVISGNSFATNFDLIKGAKHPSVLEVDTDGTWTYKESTDFFVDGEPTQYIVCSSRNGEISVENGTDEVLSPIFAINSLITHLARLAKDNKVRFDVPLRAV